MSNCPAILFLRFLKRSFHDVSLERPEGLGESIVFREETLRQAQGLAFGTVITTLTHPAWA